MVTVNKPSQPTLSQTHYNAPGEESDKSQLSNKKRNTLPDNIDGTSAVNKVSDKLIDAVNLDRSFVIFAHGTSQGRDTKNTTISNIVSQINGTENKDYIIVDGPSATQLPASYAYNDLDRVATRKNMLSTFGTIAGNSYKTAKLKAAITGAGSEHSAATAVGNIIDLKDKGGIPGKINIVGYSRGAAVTASQVVHQLKSVFGYKISEEESNQIQINLFLIDPVAGRKDGEKPVNRLSPNNANENVHIKSLYAIYGCVANK